MRRTRTGVLAGIAVCSLLGSLTVAHADPAPDSAEARVEISNTKIAGPVPEQLLGANERWRDDQLGAWDPDAGRASRDIVELANRLPLNVVRYPGGTVANLFRWKRAIGPQDDRGCQIGGGFVGRQEPLDSRYGPDENEQFAAEIGAETIIMTSSVQPVRDAADYVEYMNAPVGANPNGGVDWAAVRAENGHPEPYGVSTWEIGNELYLGNQAYWRADQDQLDRRLRQYAFGGTQRKTDEPVGTDCDHRTSASFSSGGANQTFQVHWAPVLPDSQSIKVDGTAWTEVDDLAQSGPTDQVYSFDPESGVITFGDGQHGAIPESGAQVTADYTSGEHPGFVDYYRAMKKVDPKINICTAWEKTDWVELMGTEHPYDCIAPHLYARPDVLGDRQGTVGEIQDVWFDRSNPENAHGTIGELRELEQALDTVFGDTGRRPFFLVSEWGAIPAGGTGPRPWGWPNSVSRTLYTADMLGGMINHDVRGAVNSNLNLHRPTTGELFGGSPDFHWTGRANVLQLYGRMIGSTPVGVSLSQVPEASTGRYDALTSYATVGADGIIRVIVVNRDQQRPLAASVQLPRRTGRHHVTVLTSNGAKIDSYNEPGAEDEISTAETTATARHGLISRTFDAHSVTLLEFRPA